MKKSVFSQPPLESLVAFAAGDPIAEAEVLELILPQLYRWSTMQYPNLPTLEVQGVVNQVVHEACRPSVRYDPTRGTTLTTYLIKRIRQRMADLYHVEQKRDQYEGAALESNEKDIVVPYNRVEGDQATRQTQEQFFSAALLELDEVEQTFLQLMRQGEKEQAQFAAILAKNGVLRDAAKDVKNTKERLQRKLLTLANRWGYILEDLLEQ